MNSQDQLQLESERKFLKQQLDSLPSNAVLTRSSVQSRMRTVEDLLSTQLCQPLPVKAMLTFRGRPVVGSHGVYAEFGTRATNAFTEAVATISSALLGPLAPTGPLPRREQCQFLITGTAIGSFGFEFEEHRPGALPIHCETAAARALKVTLGLLACSAQGGDDELAEFVADTGLRSVQAVRNFVDVLATHDAVCTLIVGKRSFRFSDIGEVRRSLAKLSQDNVHESESMLFGEFQGVLPKGRTFEFKVAADGQIVLGKIGLEIDNPETINDHLSQPVEISCLETHAGHGRPRYKLLQLPEWNSPQQDAGH